MDIPDLIVSFSALAKAYLFYLWSKQTPVHLKPQKDDDYGDRFSRFGRNYENWALIFILIITSLVYYFKAL